MAIEMLKNMRLYFFFFLFIHNFCTVQSSIQWICKTSAHWSNHKIHIMRDNLVTAQRFQQQQQNIGGVCAIALLFIYWLNHCKHHTDCSSYFFHIFFSSLSSLLKNYVDNYVVSSHNRLCKRSLWIEHFQTHKNIFSSACGRATNIHRFFCRFSKYARLKLLPTQSIYPIWCMNRSIQTNLLCTIFSVIDYLCPQKRAIYIARACSQCCQQIYNFVLIACFQVVFDLLMVPKITRLKYPKYLAAQSSKSKFIWNTNEKFHTKLSDLHPT